MNKLMVLCLLAHSLIAMDVPARCHNSRIFTELGIIETDELNNAVQSDIGIYVPDNDFIVEYPGTTKYADAVIKKTTAPVMIKKINHLLGYGVFAQESIAADAVVGEYTGTICTLMQKIAGTLLGSSITAIAPISQKSSFLQTDCGTLCLLQKPLLTQAHNYPSIMALFIGRHAKSPQLICNSFHSISTVCKTILITLKKGIYEESQKAFIKP